MRSVMGGFLLNDYYRGEICIRSHVMRLRCGCCRFRSSLAACFQVFEGRPHTGGNRTAAGLRGHQRRAALRERYHRVAKTEEVIVLGIAYLHHPCSQRTNKSIARENPEEGSNQRGGYFMSNFFRRTSEGSHRDNDAKNRGDNSKAWKRIRR